MTIIASLVQTSVEQNGLLIPGRLLESALSRYCVPLGYWTEDSRFPVSIPGSATLLKYRKRYILACTRHQLKGLSNLRNICVILSPDHKTRCITSGGYLIFHKDANEDDHTEIALFDFTAPATALPELKPMFFDLQRRHPHACAEDVVAVITYGYPTEKRNIDYDSGKFEVSKRVVVCTYEGEGRDVAVHILQPTAPINFVPDGMSGGPAFVVLKTANGFSVYFAGMNVRGNESKMCVIKAGAIQIMMDRLIDGGETAVTDRVMRSS